MNNIKKFTKKKFALIVMVVIIMLFCIPIFLDYMNLGRHVPFYRSTSPDGWLSFLMGLLGFISIFISIQFSKEQFMEDKRIGIKPYLDITLESPGTKRCSSIGIISINYDNMNINLYENKIVNLVITNLGLGNCLRCEVIEIKLNGIKLNEDVSYIGNIRVNDSIKSELMIVFWFGDILENLKRKYIDKQLAGSPENFKEKINKSSLNTVELIMKYKDILGNEYKKNIVLNVNADFELEFDEQFRIKNIRYNYLNIEHDEKKDSEICL